jgi:hypothetical protein
MLCGSIYTSFSVHGYLTLAEFEQLLVHTSTPSLVVPFHGSTTVQAHLERALGRRWRYCLKDPKAICSKLTPSRFQVLMTPAHKTLCPALGVERATRSGDY